MTNHKAKIKHNFSSKRVHKKRKIKSDPVRDLAFEILSSVMEKQKILEIVLSESSVIGRDKAAAHRLAATALRHYGTLYEILKPMLKRQPPYHVELALIIGIVQILFLKTPGHAAVNTTVDLVHRLGLTAFSGLVNALLRRVLRDLEEGSAEIDLTQFDQPRLDTPSWLWTSWGERARAITKGYYKEPSLDVTIHGDLKKVLKQYPELEQSSEVLPSGSLRLLSKPSITDLSAFQDGKLWVQDAAAAIPVKLMGDITGKRIIDLCAAPGGKTAQLVAGGACVQAVEYDEKRSVRLKENLERLNLSCDIINDDALIWRPQEKADIILLDAPCSATGTLRRHPDVLYNKRWHDIKKLAKRQWDFLESAHAMLKKGGILFYVICSLQDEEGPDIIKKAILSKKWTLKKFTQEDLSFFPESLTKEGFYRTHPGMLDEKGGVDGFFAARLMKI